MNISNDHLFNLCKKYGASALFWRQKFIGLLPEVNRRKLYEKKNFSSIFEFAKKLCGLSEKQVKLALNLEKRFRDKPSLKQVLVNGEVSINKLTRIASVATVENEAELADRAKILPKKVLETFVRGMNIEKRVGEGKSLPGQKLDFEFSDEVVEQLNELNAKGINPNEVILELLKKREEEIASEKERIAEGLKQTKSQYIPRKIKKILEKEHGMKCSIKYCNKPSKEIHHTQRFSLSGVHDPRFLAPLCREHHVLAHSVDVKYCEALADKSLHFQ